jgi:hypothetical protein
MCCKGLGNELPKLCRERFAKGIYFAFVPSLRVCDLNVPDMVSGHCADYRGDDSQSTRDDGLPVEKKVSHHLL